ncbi:MAG: hypothetical protein ACP5JJ_15550 [Anaerolineae bacterium]
MNPRQQDSNQKQALEHLLRETLIDGGLAGLVPLAQRRRDLLFLRLALVFFLFLGLLGLPVLGILSILALALAAEAAERYRQQGGAPDRVLLWPFFWERIRPPFYWTLAISTTLVALFLAKEPFLGAILRGAFQWCLYRIIQDSLKHPEHYGSWRQFQRWWQSRWKQMAPTFQIWAGLACGAIIAVLFVNLSARNLWELVGQAAWSRLLLFGGGFYLAAVLAFLWVSRAGVRRAVRHGVQNWDRVRLYGLDSALRSAQAMPGVALVDAAWVDVIENRLGWKNLDNLVSRVGSMLDASLTGFSRWAGLLLSGATFVLVTLVTIASVFLIMPREVMARWTFPGEAPQEELLLAVNDLEELLDEEFQVRLLQADPTDWAREPLLKVAFFEAVVVTSLILLQTAIWHPRATLASSLATSSMNNWLTLGTAYLLLLENQFQYLYNGFISQRRTGSGLASTLSLENHVLFVPSATSRARIYESICEFLRTYELPECNATSCAIAVFDNHQTARRWAKIFFRADPLEMERMRDSELFLAAPQTTAEGNCWIWWGGPLVGLSSLEEARRYGRLVAHGREGVGLAAGS